MPLPSENQAGALGLLRLVPPGICPGCGKRRQSDGKILCHECRLACDISEQMTLDEMEEDQ